MEATHPSAGRERLLLSWSGGKDCTRALYEIGRGSEASVESLFSTLALDFQRISMHGVRRELIEAQARALGLPLEWVPLPVPCPNEEYERRMGEALAPWVARGLEGVAFGDIFLEDLRRFREEKLARVGLCARFPIWARSSHELAREFIALGFRAVVVCVDLSKLSASFAGREFDAALVDELPREVDPCGENGEFHTFVWDGPLFRTPVRWRAGELVARDGFAWRDLVPDPAGD